MKIILGLLILSQVWLAAVLVTGRDTSTPLVCMSMLFAFWVLGTLIHEERK